MKPACSPWPAFTLLMCFWRTRTHASKASSVCSPLVFTDDFIRLSGYENALLGYKVDVDREYMPHIDAIMFGM